MKNKYSLVSPSKPASAKTSISSQPTLATWQINIAMIALVQAKPSLKPSRAGPLHALTPLSPILVRIRTSDRTEYIYEDLVRVDPRRDAGRDPYVPGVDRVRSAPARTNGVESAGSSAFNCPVSESDYLACPIVHADPTLVDGNQ
ncbi:hypothetical protein TMatcc_008726 [Talaromyces marneffei ATCC 18224]